MLIIGMSLTAQCDEELSLSLMTFECDSDQGEFTVTIQINGNPNESYFLSGVGFGAPISVPGLDIFTAGPYADDTAVTLFIESAEDPSCSASISLPVLNCGMDAPVDNILFTCLPQPGMVQLQLDVSENLGVGYTVFITGHAPFILQDGFSSNVILPYSMLNGDDYEISISDASGEQVFYLPGTLIIDCSEDNCFYDTSLELLSGCYDEENGGFYLTFYLDGIGTSNYELSGTGIDPPQVVYGQEEFSFFYPDSTTVTLIASYLPWCFVAVYDSGGPIFPGSEFDIENQAAFCPPYCDYEVSINYSDGGSDSEYTLITLIHGLPGETYLVQSDLFNDTTLTHDSAFQSPFIDCGVDASFTVTHADCTPRTFPLDPPNCAEDSADCDFEWFYEISCGETDPFDSIVILLSIVGMPNESYTVNGVQTLAGDNGVAFISVGPFESFGPQIEISIELEGSDCPPGYISIFPENCGLSVDLLAFSGEALPEGNFLRWSTGTEVDNDYFTIERSLNGIDEWEIVRQVHAWGNSSTQIDYACLDGDAPKGRAFYRLKDTNLSGVSSICSKVIPVNGAGADFAINHLYPVPTTDIIHVSISAEKADMVNARIFDVTGQQVYSFLEEMNEGINTLDIDLSDFSSGTYFLTLRSDREIIRTKLVKH